MHGSAGPPDPERPIERFKPTTGIVVGWSGLVLAVVVIAYVALADHSLFGLRLGWGAAFAGVLVWATQLRPRITAYPDALLMHGSPGCTRRTQSRSSPAWRSPAPPS